MFCLTTSVRDNITWHDNWIDQFEILTFDGSVAAAGEAWPLDFFRGGRPDASAIEQLCLVHLIHVFYN